MNTLELSDEQLDAICLALNLAADKKIEAGEETDLQLASIFEKLRKNIRKQYPLTASFKKLVLELEA